MNNKKCILLLIANPSQHGFSEVLSSVFDNTNYYIHPVSIEQCTHLRYEAPYPPSKRLSVMTPSGKGIKRLIKTIIYYNTWLRLILGHLANPFYYILWRSSYLWRQRNLLREMHKNIEYNIRKLSAVAVIMPGIPYFSWELIYFPKTKLPVIALPNYGALSLSFLLPRNEKYQFRGTLERRLLDWLAPQWAHEDSGERIYPATPFFLLSILACGAKPGQTLEDLRARFTGGCLFSVEDKEILEEYGPVPENWPITGDISSDRLMRRQQDRGLLLPMFFERYGFIYTRTIAFDLQSYPEEHLERLLRVAQFAGNIGWNVIFCPHPGLAKHFIEPCERAGFIVSPEKTVDVLPLVDFYVSCDSSTCQWTAQLGIPTLSIGLLGRLGFTGEGGLYFEKQNAEQFYEKLESILKDDIEYEKIRQSATKSSMKYGMLDGKCEDRVRNYIINIITNWNK